jgi:4-hydroxy-tetrahydrodipicolinate synthase
MGQASKGIGSDGIGSNGSAEAVGRLPRGVVASSVTPTDADGELRLDLIGPHIDWLIAEGVDGISPLGSSGEFVALSSAERKDVTEATLAAIDGRVHSMVGTHHYSTKEAIALSRHAEAAGADSLLVVAPYYMRPSRPQVMDHYRRIAASVSVPIVVYHNAVGTGVDLTSGELTQLFDEGAISGVKMSNADPDRVLQLLERTDGALRVYVGLDAVGFEGLCHGAHGWISGIPSIVPRKAKELYETLAVDHDLEKGRVLWRALAPLMRLQFAAFLGRGDGPHWLSVSKGVLNLIGPYVGEPIPPVQPLSAADVARVTPILANLGYSVASRRGGLTVR